MPCIMRANSSLKPNRDLINTHFEGYKFTTTSHTVNSTRLPGPVCRAREEGYNYQITKRSCLFNHLSYHNNTSYFVCKVGSVSSGGVSSGGVSSGGVSSSGVSSGGVSSINNDETVALFSYTDGGGIVKETEFTVTSLKTNISVFPCGERIYLNLGVLLIVLERHEDKWSISHTHNLTEHFMLLKVEEEDAGRVLVVTCTKNRGYKHKFYRLSSDTLELFHTIECSGIASLVTLKDKQLTLIVEGHLITQETTSLEGDSGKREPEESEEKKKEKRKNYSWSQTMEDVEVVVALPKGLIKNDLCVDIGVQTVEVSTAGGQKLFEGILFNKIEPQDSFWQLNDDRTECELHLSKYQQAHNWSCLLRQETKEEEEDKEKKEEDRMYPLLNDISDLDPGELEAMVNRIRSLDQFTSETLDTSPYHTAQQEVEEIDEIQGSPLSLLTYTLSDTDVASDKIMELAPGSLLFTIRQDDSIVITHNVDALVYKCVRGAWTHCSTLQAFNHIQASKTQKKFMIAPAEGTYVAIVDTTRNIFIYRTTSTNNGKLTVLGLEDDSEIIGSVALAKSIILLTTQYMITVQFDF